MRKLTITLLLIITIFFAACASQPAPKPQAQQTAAEDKPPVVIKSLRISNGTVVETTRKIYGPPPKDCEEAKRLEVPCWAVKDAAQSEETGRKQTPAEQSQSLKPGR